MHIDHGSDSSQVLAASVNQGRNVVVGVVRPLQCEADQHILLCAQGANWKGNPLRVIGSLKSNPEDPMR